MDRESLIELQKIDCNCNDCIYMERDFELYKKWEDWHRGLDLKEFNRKKEAALKLANECLDPKGKESLLKMANKMQFVFEKKHLIQYGNCSKFDKPVTFLPNICQLHTQECFKHRREN